MTGAGHRRILIVEDDPEIQHILSVILAGEGREIISVDTGTAARRVFEDGDVDLVVLDLILPDADGRTMLSELRSARDTAALPVVVMTARAGPDVRQDCYALGADGFIEKPFDPESVAVEIGAHLERHAAAERQALSDALTGLLNRAGLEALVEELAAPYGLAVIQLDGFAARSERWGWERSEGIVREVSRALRRALPEEFELARLAGADFALVAPGADLESVRGMASEALAIVRAHHVDEVAAGEAPLTATIALVAAAPGDPLEESLETARQRLFQAREAEGDQVVPEDAEPAASGHVLVAEDDEISATILLHRLEKEGLEVVHFDNGHDAWEDVFREMPILVILDVKMPRLDGFEVLERLRKEHRFSDVPVIMLTSMGQEADIVRAFRMGADDYILKPFSPTELSARVRRLLTRGRSASSL